MKITIIGGSSMEIIGRSMSPISNEDLNIGQIVTNQGGTGLNISSALANLDCDVNLITALSSDFYSDMIRNRLDCLQVKHINTNTESKFSTAKQLSIYDENNESVILMCDNDIISTIKKEDLSSTGIAPGVIVVDSNLEREIIEYIANLEGNYYKVISPKYTDIDKCIDLLHKFHLVKMNVKEAERCCGFDIKIKSDIFAAGEKIIKNSKQRLFITTMNKGSYAFEKKTIVYVNAKNFNFTSSSSVHDMFTAGGIYSYINKYNLINSCKFATLCSIYRSKLDRTTNKNISLDDIMSMESHYIFETFSINR